MKKIKKCSGLCRFAHLHMFSSPPWTGWHSLISPQTETLVCRRKPQDTSPEFVLHTDIILQRAINSIDCFLSYLGDPDYFAIIFKTCVALGSIQEAVGPVAWLLNTSCFPKNEIYLGCIPEVNIMTSFTLSKGQPCQTRSSQYATAHPFSTGAQPKLGLWSAGTEIHRSDKDK